MEEKTIESEDIIQALPIPLFLINRERRVLRMNRAAEEFIRTSEQNAFMRRGGEALRCVNSSKRPQGCGSAEECSTCPLRLCIAETFATRQGIRRKPASLQILDSEGGSPVDVHLLLTTSPIFGGSEDLALLIIQDVSELVQLRDIIPICSRCKKIRTEEKYWQSVETYLENKFDVTFSHGLCHECARILYPEQAADEKGTAGT